MSSSCWAFILRSFLPGTTADSINHQQHPQSVAHALSVPWFQGFGIFFAWRFARLRHSRYSIPISKHVFIFSCFVDASGTHLLLEVTLMTLSAQKKYKKNKSGSDLFTLIYRFFFQSQSPPFREATPSSGSEIMMPDLPEKAAMLRHQPNLQVDGPT
jgi:hypothetical protein